MLIDTHFHLDKYKNYRYLYKYITESKMYFLCVTTSPSIYIACKQRLGDNKYVRFALGMHPLECKFEDISLFKSLVDSTRYIGEIGLDNKSKGINQIEMLDQIFSICYKKNKIYSIHCNNMEYELYNLLSNYPGEKVIIHWYHGNVDKLKDFIKYGCYFSINSSMVRSEKNMEMLRKIPIDRLLIESDGPFTYINKNVYTPDKLASLYKCISDFLNYDFSYFVKKIESNFKTILT